MGNIQMTYGISSLKMCIIKFTVLLITLLTGLIGGLNDSYSVFYITVLVQSLNNAYDAASYLTTDYQQWVVIPNFVVCITNVLSFAASIAHLTPIYAFFEQQWIIITICVILSVPLFITCIQMFLLLKNKQY